MPFTSYADAGDVEVYVKGSIVGLWGGDDITDTADTIDSLGRAAREINDKLRGLDRFSADGVPIEAEDDGSYAEILIKLNVYTAVYNQVASTHAGEIFEDHWKWLRDSLALIWKGIKSGEYQFGSEPDEATSGSKVFEIGRSSP